MSFERAVIGCEECYRVSHIINQLRLSYVVPDWNQTPTGIELSSQKYTARNNVLESLGEVKEDTSAIKKMCYGCDFSRPLIKEFFEKSRKD